MRRQILMSLLLPIFITFVLLSYFNITAFESVLNSSIKQKADTELSLIIEKTERILEQADLSEDKIETMLDQNFCQFTQIKTIKITNGSTFIYSFINPKKDKLDNSYLYNTCDLHLNNKAYGPLQIEMTREQSSIGILSRINLFINFAFILIFITLAYISISSWITNAVERPLSNMLSAQQKLARGEFDVRIQTKMSKSNEIIGILSSFNTMAQELENFKKEIEEKNETLETINKKYKKLNDMLETQVRDKTKELREFFSLITHDLKVPLAASQGYAALLLKEKTGKLNEKQEKFVKSIALANTHLTHLVRNLIDSFKYENDSMNYFFQNFYIDELEEEIQSNLALQLEEKNLELTLKSSCNNRPYVYGDKIKITRVLLNLLSNAIKISEAGSQIILSIKEDADLFYISVTDFGKGIEQKYIDEIFNKFTQFPYSSTSTEGTGLGLYIVKKIISGHGQTITVKSKENKGTEFTFSLKKASIDADE